MDNENKEKNEAAKEALRQKIDAAANAMAGPIGGIGADLASKTKIGDNLLNKGSNNFNRLSNFGRVNNNDQENLDNKDNSIPTINEDSSLDSKDKASEEDKKTTSKEESDISLLGKKAKARLLTYGVGGIAISFLFLILFIIVLAGPVMMVKSGFDYIYEKVTSFFSSGNEEKEQAFYNELDYIRQKNKNNYDICIDTNLIHATLIVKSLYNNFDYDEVVNDLNKEAEDENGNSYKKMTREIDLLAKMQTTEKKYSVDSNWKIANGSYCKDTESIELVTWQNKDSFDLTMANLEDGITSIDSSNYEKIASNDLGLIVKKEKNYSFYLYYPAYDSEGNCSDDYVKEKLDKINSEDNVELSVGSYEDMENSVYYWNLVNQFIPEYYDNLLPSSAYPEDRNKAIKEIASEIYSIYNEMGPTPSCSSQESYIASNSHAKLCPNGITIDGVGTIDFEDYIAGVVSREAYVSEGMEALKAQAVAARTYAINYTNYCEKPIGNSTKAQTFTEDIKDNARQAVKATSGQIMTYNGKVFSSQYDSFCFDDKDCPDSSLNDGVYTVTYTRVPSSATHVITLSDSNQFKRLTRGQGHAHGMSQLLSYQMAKEGMDYRQILKYFYADGIEIVVNSGSDDWKQSDPQWSNTKIGNSNKTLGKIGCYVTSLAIMISRSGVDTTLGDNFNPGTFTQELNRLNTFDSVGRFTRLKSITDIAPEFKYVQNKSYDINKMASDLDSGYYIMLNITYGVSGEHHVVVNSIDVANNKIYMSDPGRFGDEFFEAFKNKHVTSLSYNIYSAS